MAGRAATTNIFPGDYALAVGPADMPAPHGWRWVALDQVARLESGHTPSRNFPEYWDEGIPWISIPDAREHHGRTITSTRQTVSQLGLDNSAARLLPAGTVCLSRTASVGYVVVMGREMATSQDFVNFVCGPELDPQFLRLLLIAEKDALLRFGKGTTHTTIYYPEVKAFHVCLPPLAQQRAIVAKLDELRSQVKTARGALDSIPPLLEKLRQSILAAAFRGDLTKDWRAKHPDVEPASELLKRIRVERRKKWEEAELAKMVAKGKPPKDDRWRAKYEEPKPVDTTGLPELPEGWCWGSLDMALDSLRNGIGTKPDRASGQRILRISAVRPLRLNCDDVRYLPEDLDVEGYQLQHGDLLLTRYNGNPDLVGVAAVVRRLEMPTTYPDKLIRAVPATHVASADFLELAINTGATRRHIAGRGKSAAGQVGVSGDDIRTAPVPIPPITEQSLICERVAALLMKHETLLGCWNSAAEAIPQLERAVLARAFRGELVPQHPNDEPVLVGPAPSVEDGAAPRCERPSSRRRASSESGPDSPNSAARPKRTRRKAS